MTGRRLALSGLSLTIVIATAVSSWWLIGDLTETDPASADYIVRPPVFLTAHERTIGVFGLIMLVIATAVVVLVWRRARPRREWSMLLTVWIAAAVGAAFAERVLTAGVIGANIGGGMLIFVSPVAAMLLIGISIWLLTRVHRDQSPAARRSFEPFDAAG